MTIDQIQKKGRTYIAVGIVFVLVSIGLFVILLFNQWKTSAVF